MSLESEQASWEDREKEEKLINQSLPADEAAKIEAANLKRAHDMGFDSIKAFEAWLSNRPGASNGFTPDHSPINPTNKTSRTSPHSGTKFNTTNWDSDWSAARELGKKRKR